MYKRALAPTPLLHEIVANSRARLNDYVGHLYILLVLATFSLIMNYLLAIC